MYSIKDKSELIAYAFIEETQPDQIYIELVEVHPDYQRRGLATSLVQKIFEEYPEHDFLLNARPQNDVQSFWRKHGFCMLGGYFVGGSTCPILIKTSKDLKEFYTGDDTLTKKYLGAIWSSEEKRFVPKLK